MKELSEYTAEVMRRADEKKRARKRAAIQTVSLCVPLALAASAALILLPRSKPGTDIEAAVPTHDVPDGAAPESAADITVFVEPMSADDQFIESQEAAENASHSISDSALKDELIAMIDGVVNGEESPPVEEAVDAAHDEGYIVTLKGSDGNVRRYALKPLTLTDLDQGIDHRVTEEQYGRLLELIRGIEQKGS